MFLVEIDGLMLNRQRLKFFFVCHFDTLMDMMEGNLDGIGREVNLKLEKNRIYRP